MHRLSLFAICLLMALCSFGRDVKITVSPSTAKIYVDGNYVGDGTITASVKSKDGFIAVKIEEPGYVTLETKIYSSDKRKAVAYTLRRDVLFDYTIESGIANHYFTVNVSKDLYTVDNNGKKDTEKVWKLIHQILLNYYDEIQTTDINSGFIQTPWSYKKLTEVDKVIRTRVSVRENGIGDDLTFQIKVSSEMTSVLGANNAESYKEVNRIVKEIEPIISEFQTRLGK